MYKNDDFVKLCLRVKPGPRYVWLSALKETAAFYGWDEAFPTLLDVKTEASGSGYFADPGRKGWKNGGGIELRISRSPKTTGWPAGLTNAFRVSSDAAMGDIAEIAKRTQVDFSWITCLHGGRRPRRWWLETPFAVRHPSWKGQAAG